MTWNFAKGQNYRNTKQISGCQRLEVVGVIEKHEGLLGGDRTDLYLDWGRGYVTAHIYKNYEIVNPRVNYTVCKYESEKMKQNR